MIPYSKHEGSLNATYKGNKLQRRKSKDSPASFLQLSSDMGIFYNYSKSQGPDWKPVCIFIASLSQILREMYCCQIEQADLTPSAARCNKYANALIHQLLIKLHGK